MTPSRRCCAGLKAAEAAGLTPIKINCVVIGGTNDDEVVEFARWARETGYEVRFIEYMPLDAQHAWEREKVVPAATILERIDDDLPAPVATATDGEPATTYAFADGAPGRDRRDRQRHRAVLRHVQSAADHRRGTVPQLPVRTGRDRPARADARRARPTTNSNVLIREAMWRKWSGHRINHAGLRAARSQHVDDRRLTQPFVPGSTSRHPPFT